MIFTIIGILIMFLPIILKLSATCQLLCIFFASIFLWITNSIETGSILCLSALCLLPGITPAIIFTNSFGNTTIMFLIFSFLLTYSLSETGVLKRVALSFINNPIAKRNIWCFIGFYFLSILFLGSFTAPTTIFILFYGITQEIYKILNLNQGDKLARNMMIGTGFLASISCAMTPIAHTFPLMALGYFQASTGNIISYISYLKYGLPIGIILGIITFILLSYNIKNEYNLKEINFEKIPWSQKEIISSLVFICVVFIWLIIGIWPKTFVTLASLGTVWPAMIGCIILSLTGCLNISQGFSKGISWTAILLCAATLSLGSILKMEEFGILAAINSFLNPILINTNILLLIIILTVVLTNLISNIVTTTISYNLIVPFLLTSNLFNPIVATIFIGIGASLAYALPSSIAHIALAGSSGWATSKDMFKYGSVMIVISIITMFIIGSII